MEGKPNRKQKTTYFKYQNPPLRFLCVSSATLSCSCRHTVSGLSPAAHTGDGTTDLIIVRSYLFIDVFILVYF